MVRRKWPKRSFSWQVGAGDEEEEVGLELFDGAGEGGVKGVEVGVAGGPSRESTSREPGNLRLG